MPNISEDASPIEIIEKSVVDQDMHEIGDGLIE
jgi:hypothetical protein